ncbi:phosphoribosyltransferase [Bartonella sp. F02]|uniref:phosphoribosyltransferase n=1 Tax=Bartonella sp. F02 TaxID=2967262 RepID=UPI0022A93C45|nr:phosphoribosyltransferase [Bartonella sp. F02]MCZ2328957.1 phosphoribosyltransferase [Bartonella sp. F02]
MLAVEGAGNNKIPMAIAKVLADRLGLDVESGIGQREKIGRTGTGSDHRLAFNPTFNGNVKAGQEYLIVDDNLTMGGTIASLRGYVENRGGKVIGACVMTAHENSLDLAIKPKMLAAIANKHGLMMNKFVEETFGYGIEKLTQAEAGHFRAAPTVDAIRIRIHDARDAGSRRLDGARDPASEKRERERGQIDIKSLQNGSVGNRLQTAAEGLQREQRTLLETASLEQTYQETLAFYVQAKHEQMKCNEDRLENLIDQQQAKLQQMRIQKPSRFSMPRSKRVWRDQQVRQQARLQTLHTRLEAVHTIKKGMGLYAPKIEELATRKMRIENPKLASDWDAMREAIRRQTVLDHQKKRKQSLEKNRGQKLGLSRHS